MSDVLDLPPSQGLQDRRTTPDHVAEALREAILTGRIAEGAELNQVALADHFEVSRVPIREALRQLQAEGLVRQEAHRRAVVTTLPIERTMEMFDLRVMLETYMLRKAIEAIDDETVGELEDLVASMADLEDHDEWLAANREFHRGLYEPAGTVYTQELAEQIAARTTRYLYRQSGGVGIHAEDEAHGEHLDILAAVRSRDAERACRALEQHIEGTRDRVAEFFEDDRTEARGA